MRLEVIAALTLGGLAFLLMALAAMLMERSRGRELRLRVRAAAQAGEALRDAPTPAPVVRSLRAAEEETGILIRVAKLTGFDPAMPRDRGIPWPLVLLIGATVGILIALRLLGIAGPIAAGAAGMAAALLTSRAIFQWQRRRYRAALFAQIPDTMALIVRAIRVGLPIGESLQTVARESQEPTRSEFARLLGEIAVGRSLDQALVRLSRRTGIAEYGFFAATISLQTQTGGSLAEPLENLSDLVRKRVQMAKKVRALTAEARFSAIVVAALPFLNVAMMSATRPGYFLFFIEDPRGIKMTVVGLSLMTLGILTIRHLVQKTAEA
jgi:tight adherence protein B